MLKMSDGKSSKHRTSQGLRGVLGFTLEFIKMDGES